MIKLTRKTAMRKMDADVVDTTVTDTAVVNTAVVNTTLSLPLHSRIKSRLRVTLDNGMDAGLLLERGTTLKDGDRLFSDDGYCVEVRAANEMLSVVRSDDPHLLARICYHLGNRHMSIQIKPGEVSYLHDHVIDEMLVGLEAPVIVMEAPFEPEPGAYGGSAEKGHGLQRGRHHHAHSH